MQKVNCFRALLLTTVLSSAGAAYGQAQGSIPITISHMSDQSESEDVAEQNNEVGQSPHGYGARPSDHSPLHHREDFVADPAKNDDSLLNQKGVLQQIEESATPLDPADKATENMAAPPRRAESLSDADKGKSAGTSKEPMAHHSDGKMAVPSKPVTEDSSKLNMGDDTDNSPINAKQGVWKGHGGGDGSDTDTK